MDQKTVKAILNTHDEDIEAAILSLQALCLTDAPSSREPQHPSATSAAAAGCAASEAPEDDTAGSSSKSLCMDVLMLEMAVAADVADARARAARVLDAFESGIMAAAEEKLQGVATMNDVLKKAVLILHRQTVAQREALKEAPHLRRALDLCQEQLRTSEINNYALKIRLKSLEDHAASEATRFIPNVF